MKKSYLERLQFDPKLWNGPVAKYITNIRIVILLIISIVSLGVFGYLNLPQRLNPEIKIPLIIVTTVLPGAGPEDVESLLTIPLENSIRGLNGIDTITSTSQDNVSSIVIQFVNSISPEKAKTDVKSSVDTVTSLPTDARAPSVIALDFENQPVWQFAVTTTGDLPSLMNFSDHLKDVIENDTKVDRVVLRGFQTQEIAVQLSPEKLVTYGISPLALAQAVKTGVASYPAGNVDSSGNTFTITIDPAISSIEDVRALRIRVGNQSMRLGDIAIVQERSLLNQASSYVATESNPGERAVTFAVYKISTADIVKTTESVQKEVEKEIEKYNGRFSVTTIMNTGEMINAQFADLLGEFRSTILLVVACLLVFLGFRQAILSSITVPLTFLSAFFFMQMFGMSINFLSLFAFLLALGLLIDDTIVTVSAMTTYYRTGKFTPAETGLIVWRDTIIPIWSTTITTIWSFIPLLLSSGIIGEFIKPIPIVISVTMISSTAIAVLITLPIMIILLKPSVPKRVIVLIRIVVFLIALGTVIYLARQNEFLPVIVFVYLVFLLVAWRLRKEIVKRFFSLPSKYPMLSVWWKKLLYFGTHGLIRIDGFAEWYHRLISRILDNKASRRSVIIAIVGYALFSFLLLPAGFVKNEFFPKTESEKVYLNVEMPSGTTLGQTQQEALRILDTVRKTKNVDYTVLEVGAAASGGFGGGSESNNVALITLHLPDKEVRKEDSISIAEKLRKQLPDFHSTAKLNVVEESGGPPAGSDINIKLSGEDLGTLTEYADKVVWYLSSQSGITNVEKSIKPGTSALVFVPDQEKLSQAGVTVDSIGLALRTYASGFTLDDVNFDKTSTEKENIVFSFGYERPSVESLGRIMISAQNGSSYPLLSLGKLETKANPTIITREEGRRTISVSAAVSAGFSASQKNQDLLKFTETLDVPAGYAWSTGGANEENQKSIQSILQAMVIAFLLILVTMVVQFQSYRQAVIVLMVIPLAVSSVFVVFALTGTPLSFPALIGVLSLFGIVVTNSMFIVDKININLQEGMEFKEAIADAGSSRMEPIILTKLCTVFGLLPITLSNPLWRGLGGAIISGLLIASTIMLLFIPVVYYEWMKPRGSNSSAK